MKKFIAISVMFAVVCSCSDSAKDLTGLEFSQTICGTSANDHSVHLEDVVTLTRAQTNNTRAFSDVKARICCYEDEKHDTLLYICNHDKGGWTIYSSDTRVPAIVAQSGNGTFEESIENESLKVWIESIAEDMRLIKSLDDSNLNFTEKEIENNKNFWKSISSPDEYARMECSVQSTRGPRDDELIPLPLGHYELVGSSTHSEVYDSISRLTRTNWHQHHPCNKSCPYKTDYSARVPAGCVPIAGAQMLYFLHHKLGVPEKAPSYAYCNGCVGSFIYWQDDYNSEVWDDMDSLGYFADPLVANVASRLCTSFGNSESSANFADLDNLVFSAYGINCTYSSFNANEVRHSLLSGMPVLLGAKGEAESKSGNETFQIGHAFIADRYKRERMVTENYYEWVYDTPPTTQVPCPPRRVETRYSTPCISMIGMNWGWETYISSNDVGWFSLTGDWIKEIGNYYYNYNDNKKMIYNFSIRNN